MMVYIMRFYKNFSLVCLLFFCLSVWAEDSRLKVERATLTRESHHYHLDASFDTKVAPLLKDAISKGLRLSFLLDFQLLEPRKYWFDKELYTASKAIDIYYHALTKQYLVSQGKEQKAYETLNQALTAMGEVEHWQLFQSNLIQTGVAYKAALSVSLNQSKLPKAIQVDAIASEDWSVESPVYTWGVNLTR